MRSAELERGERRPTITITITITIMFMNVEPVRLKRLLRSPFSGSPGIGVSAPMRLARALRFAEKTAQISRDSHDRRPATLKDHLWLGLPRFAASFAFTAPLSVRPAGHAHAWSRCRWTTARGRATERPRMIRCSRRCPSVGDGQLGGTDSWEELGMCMQPCVFSPVSFT